MTSRAAIHPRVVASLASLAILAVGLVSAGRSLSWRDAAFPGFFLMPNRVVPSAGLSDWSGVRDGQPLYQQVLVAVDGTPVTSAIEAYRRAGAHQIGDPIRYRFAARTETAERSFPLRRFTEADYWLIFGMYALTGLAYLALGFLAGLRSADAAMYGGLAAFGWLCALFGFTGMDLYGPGTLFRFHALVEALLPAAGAHLALTCPRDRVGQRPGVLPLVYGVGLAVALAYQYFLYQPAAYTIIHNLCQALSGVPLLVFTSFVALSLGDPPRPLRAPRVRLLLVGALIGIVLPALVVTLSGLTGGSLPVNMIAWPGLIFPLSAIVAVRGVRAAA